MKKEINLAVRLLKAGANEKRVQILKLLLDKKTSTVNDIAEQIGLSLSATSQHLRRLENVRLIKATRRKRWVNYSLNNDSTKKYNTRFFAFLKEVL